MRYGILFLVVFFLVVVPAISQPANLNVMLIKDWDADFVDPVFDNMYDAVQKAVLDNEIFKTIRKIDFEHQTGVKITSVFADITDPFELYKFNKNIDLNVVVLLSVKQEDLYMNVLEFPSGVLIDSLIMDKNKLGKNNIDQTLRLKVYPIFEKLAYNYSVNGYPFSSLDYGMVVFAGDIQDRRFTQKIGQMRKYYNSKIAHNNKRLLRIKIIDEKTNCSQASQLCVETGAEFALLYNWDPQLKNYNMTIVFPNQAFEKPLIDVELPCLPNEEQFVCFNWNENILNTDQFCDIIFNDEIDFNRIKDTPIVLNKLFGMHRFWINKNKTKKIDPDHIYDYYILLFNYLPDNSIKKAWVGLNYAGYYRQTGQYIQANSMLTETYTIFRDNANISGMMLSLLEKARVAVLLKQWANALTWYESVLKIKDVSKDNLSVSGIQYNMGLISEIAGDLDQAIYHYESSAYFYNNSNEKFRTLQIYNKICRLLRETGQFEKAADYANIYLTRANELHSEPDIAAARFELGMVNFEKKDYRQAFSDLMIAKSFYDLLGESNNKLALIHLKLGIINFEGKKYADAKNNFNTTMDIAVELEKIQDVVDCYQYLGDIEVINKKWEMAQNYYDFGLKLAMKNNMNPVIAKIIYKKGLAHLYEGHVAVGYEEVKKGIELSNGKVHGGQKKAELFLNKLEKAIKK